MVINRKIRKKIKRNLKHRPAKISPGQQLKQRESITIKNRNKKLRRTRSKDPFEKAEIDILQSGNERNGTNCFRNDKENKCILEGRRVNSREI